MKRIIICIILVLSVLFGGCQNVDVQESSLEQSDTNIETDPAEQTSSEPNLDNSPTEGSLSSDTNIETDPAEQTSSEPNSDNPLTEDPLPSQTIEIQGLEKLNEMRKMVACGDETQLGQYVQSVADSGIQSKDDLIAFVKLIDALPHISVLDGSVTWIRFSHSISEDTGKETNVVYVTTEATDGDWMRVEYVLSVTDVSKKILDEKIQVGEESLLRSAVTSADGKLTFHIEMRSLHPSGRGTMIQWVGEADGIFTRIFYYTDNESDVKTEELFGALEISDEPINNTETVDDFTGDNHINDKDLESNDVINQDENHNVPYSISFSSIAEMKDFLNSTKGNIAQYEEFIQDHNINTSITQSYAQKIATNVELNDVPLVKSNWVVDEFAATYYLDRNELDIIYKVNGIRYRFVYKYNGTSSVDRTTAPIFEDLKLGTYVVDLYQGDECFVGEVVTDFVVIQIVIYTERSNDVALNIFNMETLFNSVDK